MKNKVLGSVLGAALLAGSTVAVADDMFAAENFSANFTLTTDYTFRGTTFSNDDVAMQGGFDWGYGSWFVGTWASSQIELDVDSLGVNADGAGATVELDFYFGWADNVGGVDLMVMPLWYTYPGQEGGANGGRDDATFELWTSAGMGFDNLPGTPYVTLTANYSPEFFDCQFCTGDADSALYTAINIAFALPNGWGIDFTYGHQDVGGNSNTGKVVNDFFGNDFSHTEIGLTKSAAGFDFDIRYHDNSEVDDLNTWAGADFAKDGDLEFSVSRSF